MCSSVEPLAVGDPLVGLDNVILTPHWSASTSDVWKATGQEMARGMANAATGQRTRQRREPRSPRNAAVSCKAVEIRRK